MLTSRLLRQIPFKGPSMFSKRWATAIPYDPTIILGNIVNPKKFDILKGMGALQMEIESREDQLNNLLAAKSSLDMTEKEIRNMGVTIKEDLGGDDMGESIKDAAQEFAKIQIKNIPEINNLKSEICMIEDHVESPLDYNKSLLKTDLPISSNTIKLNAQYFSFNENKQDSESTISQMKAFVSSEVQWGFGGNRIGGKASTAVQKQMSQQVEQHSVSGTLVLTASCTHANACIFAPFIIDVDKGIRAWNLSFPSDKINSSDDREMFDYAMKEGSEENTLQLVSGATYGSCFVGMVHFLKDTSSQSSQSMLSTAESLSASFDVGSMFASYKGGIGMDASFSNDLKSLLSSQTVSSHVSLVCEGCIPTLTSNNVALGVKTFAEFDPAAMMGKLATLHNDNTGDNATVSSAADNARQGQLVADMRGNEVKSAMSALSTIDEESDKILNINSLMSALEDYVDQAQSSSVGVPINFFIKSITKSHLAKMWIKKYSPRGLRFSGDDSEDTPPAE